MSWQNAGSLAATNGNKNFIGTGTLLEGAFVDDALLYTNGTTVWMSDIASIADNTHMATADNWPFSTGSIANGNWYIVPCSPLRQTTAKLNDQLSTMIAGYASIFSITASDNYGTLNKAASTNNAGLYLTTGGTASARMGTFGDNDLRLSVNPSGGGYIDGIVMDATSALCSVYGDPTAALGIATKQYVDGSGKTKVVRAASTTNITVSSPGTSIGGVTPANGERYLLAGQTSAGENGLYVYNGASSAMTRATDADSAAELPPGVLVCASEGSYANKVFMLTTAAPLVVGTTNLTFQRLDSLFFGTAQTITAANANAFTVGANGTTNPAFNVDTSATSVATGFNIKAAAAGAGLALAVLSSNANENLTLDAKGSGTITLGANSTGNIALSRTTIGPLGQWSSSGLGTTGATAFPFFVNSIEAFRLGSDGSFLVGTTTNGGWGGGFKAEFRGSSSFYQNGASSQAIACRIDNTAKDLIDFWFNTSSVGTITTNGTSTSYNISSDERLKDNIADAGDSGTIIDALRVRSWDWKLDGSHEDFGFIAQEEVTAYAPAVTVGDSDPVTITKQWSRDDSKLVPLLVKEIQSLRARLKAANL
jgi:hypothetical protein